MGCSTVVPRTPHKLGSWVQSQLDVWVFFYSLWIQSCASLRRSDTTDLSSKVLSCTAWADTSSIHSELGKVKWLLLRWKYKVLSEKGWVFKFFHSAVIRKLQPAVFIWKRKIWFFKRKRSNQATIFAFLDWACVTFFSAKIKVEVHQLFHHNHDQPSESEFQVLKLSSVQLGNRISK